MTPEQKIRALNLVLPEAVSAAADYVPSVDANGFLIISRQTPRVDGRVVVRGRVGLDVSLDEAKTAARICALRVLAVARQSLGTIDDVVRVAELTGQIGQRLLAA